MKGYFRLTGLDGVLVGFRRTGFLGQDETRTDPDGAGAESESRGETLAVEETACGDDLHGLAGQRACLALAELCDSRNEDSRGDITGVATTLATLRANEIDAEIEAFLDMLGVSDHVHV